MLMVSELRTSTTDRIGTAATRLTPGNRCQGQCLNGLIHHGQSGLVPVTGQRVGP